MSKTIREFYSGDLTVRVSTDIDEEAAAFNAKYGKPNEPERHTILKFELYDDDGDLLYKSYVEPWARADLIQAGHRYTYEVLTPHVVDFVDEAIIMSKRAGHALRTRAEPDYDSSLTDRFVWRRRRGPPTRGAPRGLINAHEWEENRRSAELGAEHISDTRVAKRRTSRTRRDPDPWRNASDADAHAYRLAEVANRLQPSWPFPFATASIEAGDAFEVAADAWEEVGDGVKAEIRRDHARHHYIEAFLAMHPHLSYGFYVVRDDEAKKLAAAVGARPPREAVAAAGVKTRLSRVGPDIELHRIHLTPREREHLNQRRPWAYAVTGVRVTGVRR